MLERMVEEGRESAAESPTKCTSVSRVIVGSSSKQQQWSLKKDFRKRKESDMDAFSSATAVTTSIVESNKENSPSKVVVKRDQEIEK